MELFTLVKNYICDTCGKSFTLSCTLKQHEITNVRNQIVIHVRTIENSEISHNHTGEKLHVCDACFTCVCKVFHTFK